MTPRDRMASCITMPGHPHPLESAAPPGPGSSLSGSRRSDSVYSNSAFHCSPSTDCILTSRRDIHHTVTRSDERKLEKLLAVTRSDERRVKENISISLRQWTRVLPSFQVSLLSHLARDYREICTRYNTLEYYFRKLEI